MIRKLVLVALLVCVTAAPMVASSRPSRAAMLLFVTRHARVVVVSDAPALLPARVYVPRGVRPSATALLMFVPDTGLADVRAFDRVTPEPKTDTSPEPPIVIYQEVTR